MNPRFPLQCLLAAWACGVIGLILGLVFEPEWFARFGSIVVLLAMMSEYALMKSELSRLYDSLNGINSNTQPDFTPSRWHQKKGLVSHITVVAGTLIWGFGDLLLQA